MKKFILLAMFTAQLLNVSAQNWLPTGNGTNNGFNGGIDLKTYNGKLIAGGAFSQAGTANANGVAMWDGTDWSIVDSSRNDFFAVRPLVIFQGQLYGFVSDSDGTNKTGYMMRLDSSFKWHTVSNSIYYSHTWMGYVFSACVYNNELYIGGGFDSIGNVNANHIAKWDGSNWTPVGTGLNNEYITGLTVYNNELYAGGAFSLAGGVAVNNLARWNGSVWSDVGGGIVPNYWAFRTMEVYNNELYIGGDFDHAGGAPMANITKWNGSVFSSVGGGLGFAGGSPEALKVYGNKLFLGGYFGAGLFHNQAGTWDGANFDSLGIGINAAPTGFEIYNCQLYAGGRFNGIGSANGVALLDTLNCTTGVNEISLPDYSILIYPNPFTSQTTISFSVEQRNTIVRIMDILGKEIKTINFTGKQLTIEKENIKAGIYFVQTIDEKKNVINNKIIIQ